MFITSTRFNLGVIALLAICLAVANRWPRSVAAPDGSVSWYRGCWGIREYYAVTGMDRWGCTYEVELECVPGLGKLVGYYPDGQRRESANLMIEMHADGCEICWQAVEDGSYYAPDGKLVGRVNGGTGHVVYCRPDGSRECEYELKAGQLVVERQWRKDGQLLLERSYADGIERVVKLDYAPTGQLRSRITLEGDTLLSSEWFGKKL